MDYGKAAASVTVIFTLLSWANASYVEAVAGAFDGSPAKANLQVAMSCGHYNKFLNPVTRQWADDLNASCVEEKRDILAYCQKKYPGMDVTNIVEADQAKNITGWCAVGDRNDCTATSLVVPVRCLVGTFESDALVVPSRCRFRHLHEEGHCQSPRRWKEEARSSCKKSKFKLASTGMLLPCANQVDQFQGVEFVCCPRHGQEDSAQVQAKPSKEVPSKQKPVPEAHGIQDIYVNEDPYFTEDEARDETEAFEEAKARLTNRQRERTAAVMQQYQEAQKKLDLTDKKYTSKKETMEERYEDSIAALELETQEQQARLKDTHERRIEDKMTKRVDVEERVYWDALSTHPLKTKKILRSFERYLKSVQKKRKHLITYYKHLRRVNPQKAAEKTEETLSLLEDINNRVDENVERLQALPEIYADIKASVAKLKAVYSDSEDNLQFIHGVRDEEAEIEREEDEEVLEEEEELQEKQFNREHQKAQPTTPLPTARKVTEAAAQAKPATTPRVEENHAAVQEGQHNAGVPEGQHSGGVQEGLAGTEIDDTELPTDFRSTMTTLEEETAAVPVIPVVVVRPIESYTADERDPLSPKKPMDSMVVAKKSPPQDSHSKTEVHVGSKAKAYSMDKSVSKMPLTSTPAVAFALACAIMGVAMGLVVAVMVVRKRAARPPPPATFNPDADPNLTVEQRHIVSMQQNGYENPTYKYFEMQ